MFSTLIKNLSYSLVYLKAAVLTFLFISVLLILLLNDPALITFIIIIYFITGVLFLNAVGYRRSMELTRIREMIQKIKNDEIKSADDIMQDKSIPEIQNEIKLMFEKISGNIDYLKKLERMRTEFIANTSHELRTPVFAIQGYLETLLDGALDDEKVNRSFLQKAHLHTISLNNLLNDLIDISMIESGEMRMHFRYFQVNELISSVIDELKPAAEEKGLMLIYTPVSKNLSLFGDKNKLRQALVNLIQNAIKYTEKGRVEVKVEDEDRFGKIIVTDTGIGIPEDDINRIFERFYRVDKARSRSVGGTGLGLAIVKHIIEAHNSKIEVNSKLNSGSEFSFRLKK